MIRYAKTKYGTLESVVSNAGFALFRGVRYAKPPVGDLRFAPPQEPDSWEGVRRCDTYGAAAPQGPLDLHEGDGHLKKVMPGYPYPPEIDEDCLFLNVYTPARSAGDKLPVMFFIHGGGFQNWYASCYEHSGDGLAGHGVVVVTIHYRMNVFGFFSHPDLKAESPSGCCGNYGILDQIQALRWVRENISAFGGDPENITIFGQSAGAISVQVLCCSPLARGLFRRAAMHSGGGLYTSRLDTKKSAMEPISLEFMDFCGCGSLEELRAMPWQVLEQHSLEFQRFLGKSFTLCVDGYVQPETMEQSLKRKTMQHVDILLGCTIDEGFTEKEGAVTGIAVFLQTLCPSVRAFARVLPEQGYKTPYVYCFDRPQPGDAIGTPHSCDNRYVFGSLAESWRPYEERDYALSREMMTYWTNFARTGDPNGEGLSLWEPFDSRGLEMRLCAEGCKMVDYAAQMESLNGREKAILKRFHEETIEF